MKLLKPFILEPQKFHPPLAEHQDAANCFLLSAKVALELSWLTIAETNSKNPWKSAGESSLPTTVF